MDSNLSFSPELNPDMYLPGGPMFEKRSRTLLKFARSFSNLRPVARNSLSAMSEVTLVSSRTTFDTLVSPSEDSPPELPPNTLRQLSESDVDLLNGTREHSKLHPLDTEPVKRATITILDVNPPTELMGAWALSLSQLVVELTTNIDEDLLEDLLLTYRIFATPLQLGRALVARFEWGLDGTEDSHLVTRVRCFVIIRKWLVDYYLEDFFPCPQLRATLLAFIGRAAEHPRVRESARDTRIVQQLKTCLQNLRKAHQGKDGLESLEAVSKYRSLPPQPRIEEGFRTTRRNMFGTLLSKARETLSRETPLGDRLIDVSPQLIAEQLCIIEQELLVPVKWQDLAGWPSDKKNPCIQKVVGRFNLACQYFTRELERLAADRGRLGQLVAHLIRVAAACLELNNYSAMLQVVLGIQTANIKGVPPTLAKSWDTLEAFASPLKNWGHIRAMMDSQLESKLKHATIPFLGVYLSDITYNSELPTFITSTLQDEQIIKFDKFRTLARIIRKIQSFQANAQYNFKKHPIVYHLCKQLDLPYL